MCICLSSCISQRPHIQDLSNFICMLPVAMAQSSFLWQNCNTLCTSGCGWLVYLYFPHNGLRSFTWMPVFFLYLCSYFGLTAFLNAKNWQQFESFKSLTSMNSVLGSCQVDFGVIDLPVGNSACQLLDYTVNWWVKLLAVWLSSGYQLASWQANHCSPTNMIQIILEDLIIFLLIWDT